jgi:hypothetical protein
MPFVLIATNDDVTTRAKEFAGLAPSEISQALADAASEINTTIFGGPNTRETLLAQVYLAAHLLSLSNPKLALAAGPVNQEKVGDVSVGYAVTAFKGSSGYNATRWGQAFVVLCRRQAGATLVVAAPDVLLPVC